MIDVAIYATVGPPLPWDDSKPLGGSEMGALLLQRMFRAHGMTCEIVNHVSVHARRTIIHRWSGAHFGQREHAVVAVHDAEPEKYAHLRKYRHVFVSEWQRRRFGDWVADRVIRPIVSERVYELAKSRRGGTPGDWLYAAGVGKGLMGTLQAWIDRPRDGRLTVATTGYDPQPWEACRLAGVECLGDVSPAQLVARMSVASGLFYRNTAPECFPVTVQIAATLGLELDVECVGHAECGIAEARVPQDCHADTLFPQWLEALRL